MSLLGLPPEWTSEAFLDFFNDIEQPNSSIDTLNRRAIVVSIGRKRLR